MAGTQFSRRVLARTIAEKLIAEPARQEYWVQTLAGNLVEHNRAAEADLLVHDIEREIFEQSGQLLVNVTSARSLGDDVRSALTGLLKDMTKASEVRLAEHTDLDLIGGLVARTPSAELDTSVRTSLQRLKAIN